MDANTTQAAADQGFLTHAVTKLSALDQLFEATGIAELKVTRGKKEVVLQLPIQSVDNEVIEAAAKPYRPRVPLKREMIQGKWVSVVNEQDPEYQDKLAEYNRTLSYLMIFHGLAVDITDEQNKVVWSADNTIQDLPEARRVAKKMGIVDSHMVSIMRAVRQLTSYTEEIQAQE